MSWSAASRAVETEAPADGGGDERASNERGIREIEIGSGAESVI